MANKLSGNREAQKAGRTHRVAIVSPKGTPRLKKVEGPNPDDKRNKRKAAGTRVQRRSGTKSRARRGVLTR